jgi:hypothetical protein
VSVGSVKVMVWMKVLPSHRAVGAGIDREHFGRRADGDGLGGDVGVAAVFVGQADVDRAAPLAA